MTVFSSRTPGSLESNRLSGLARSLRSRGFPVVDLTESNPTRVGFRYPDGLLAPLADPRGLRYEPAPLGLESARRAVAAHLGHRDIAVDPARVVLTTSTSEAYSILFKVLCDPNQEVFVPRPSYPLFEHLTRLEGVVPVPYSLEFHGRWEIDVASIRAHQAPGPKAVLVVNPNNPTGSFITEAELEDLAAICRHRRLALIVDEVFGLYPLARAPRGPSVLDRTPDVLTCVLGGLSKAVGLPQLKLGWIVVTGPDAVVDEALARIELVCDTYLSVATPTQLSAAELLDAGVRLTSQISERVRVNYGALTQLVTDFPSVTRLPIEGGWYAVMQVPATRSEEALVLELLEHDHILVQPGYFFDFPREAFLVVSLLPEPAVFEPAMRRVLTAATS